MFFDMCSLESDINHYKYGILYISTTFYVIKTSFIHVEKKTNDLAETLRKVKDNQGVLLITTITIIRVNCGNRINSVNAYP